MKIKELLVVDDSLPQFYVSHDCHHHLSLSLSYTPSLYLSFHIHYSSLLRWRFWLGTESLKRPNGSLKDRIKVRFVQTPIQFLNDPQDGRVIP